MPAALTDYMSADDFVRAISNFQEFLAAREDLINELNVFPIPDSDTGTNSLVTLTGGIAQMNGETVPQLAQSLATGCAKNALGNSGVILAAYLTGLAEELATQVDLATWQKAMRTAATRAEQAVLVPSQGTMLTIALAVANQSESTITEQLVANSTVARIALSKTTEMLPELKLAGVVDSGAVVLTLFQDAFAKLVSDSNFGELIIENTECKVKPNYSGPSHELMFNLKIGSVSKEDFLQELTKFGDSISISQISQDPLENLDLRVHIHCDDPDLVVTNAKTFGPVTDLVLVKLNLKNQ